MREREEEKNIIIKRVKVKESRRKKTMEEILKVIGVKTELEKIMKLREKKGKMGKC